MIRVIVVMSSMFPTLVGRSHIPLIKDIKSLLGPGGKTFEVDGYVTDDAGNWIDGVLLSVREHTPSFSGIEKGPEKRSHQCNIRDFKWKSDGYAELSLYFDKTGYEGQYRSYIQSGIYRQVHVILKKEVPTSRPLIP